MKTFKDFKQEYRKSNLKQARLIGYLTLLTYLAFALLDSYLIGSINHKIIIIRFEFVIIMATILSLSYFSALNKSWQSLIVFLIIVASIGVIWFATNFAQTTKMLYMQGGLLLIIYYCYSISRLLFFPATFAGVGITLLYAVNFVKDADTSQHAFYTSLFFLIAANIIGMVKCRLRQKRLYQDYIN